MFDRQRFSRSPFSRSFDVGENLNVDIVAETNVDDVLHSKDDVVTLVYMQTWENNEQYYVDAVALHVEDIVNADAYMIAKDNVQSRAPPVTNVDFVQLHNIDVYVNHILETQVFTNPDLLVIEHYVDSFVDFVHSTDEFIDNEVIVALTQTDYFQIDERNLFIDVEVTTQVDDVIISQDLLDIEAIIEEQHYDNHDIIDNLTAEVYVEQSQIFVSDSNNIEDINCIVEFQDVHSIVASNIESIDWHIETTLEKTKYRPIIRKYYLKAGQTIEFNIKGNQVIEFNIKGNQVKEFHLKGGLR